jgi:hypothetical protein
MPDKKPVSKKVAPVQPFYVPDEKKCGTKAQQLELNDFLMSLTPAQTQTIQSLLHRMTTGACINGDGTIDTSTGLRTTGGYRKSVHYMKAYFINRPTIVKLT